VFAPLAIAALPPRPVWIGLYPLLPGGGRVHTLFPSTDGFLGSLVRAAAFAKQLA